MRQSVELANAENQAVEYALSEPTNTRFLADTHTARQIRPHVAPRLSEQAYDSPPRLLWSY
mgnify:CR=1|jgi:hypothetical protein